MTEDRQCPPDSGRGAETATAHAGERVTAGEQATTTALDLLGPAAGATIDQLARALCQLTPNDEAFPCPLCGQAEAFTCNERRWRCRACTHRGTAVELALAVACDDAASGRLIQLTEAA